MGRFAREGETADVRGLRKMYGGKYRNTLNQRKRDLWSQRKVE